jgi:hypothetical protein
VEDIPGVRGPWVSRPGVDLAHHTKARCLDQGQQLVARPEPEVLGQVGQNEPSFATWSKVSGEPVQEAVKHGAVRIVDAVFEG